MGPSAFIFSLQHHLTLNLLPGVGVTPWVTPGGSRTPTFVELSWGFVAELQVSASLPLDRVVFLSWDFMRLSHRNAAKIWPHVTPMYVRQDEFGAHLWFISNPSGQASCRLWPKHVLPAVLPPGHSILRWQAQWQMSFILCITAVGSQGRTLSPVSYGGQPREGGRAVETSILPSSGLSEDVLSCLVWYVDVVLCQLVLSHA
jgi:hypothetical protein